MRESELEAWEERRNKGRYRMVKDDRKGGRTGEDFG